jgi:glutamate synthase (NADPH/NADH) small chain
LAWELRTSSSHEEGCERHWGILTKDLSGLRECRGAETVDIEFVLDGQGRTRMREVLDSDREWPAGLVLLALGFTGLEPDVMIGSSGPELDDRCTLYKPLKITSRMFREFSPPAMRIEASP